MIRRGIKEEAAGCCVLCALVLVTVLVAAYTFVVPVVVTVDEAGLSHFTLGAAPMPAGNGTGDGTPPSSLLAFNLTLVVAVRNPNWAMSACLTVPPVGELRFRGVPFARGWLPPAPVPWWLDQNRIRARRTVVYRVPSWATEGVAMAVLGSDDVAEFATESAAGVFELELVVNGEVRYQAHHHRRRFRASCPLKLSLSTSMETAVFARVTCT